MEARIVRILIALLVMLSLCALSAYKAWNASREITVIKYQGKLDRQERDSATARAGAERLAREHLQRETERANSLAASLDTEKAAHSRVAAQLKTRSKNVTREFRPGLDSPPVPLPRTVFTVGFLRQLNEAIGADPLPEPFAAAAAAVPADKAAAFDALESGLTQPEILDFLADYGQQCKDTAAQLNRVIDFYEGTPNAN